MASNYPLSYKLSWLPRFLWPSLNGEAGDFAPASGALLDPPSALTARLAFVGDISAVANRTAPLVHPAIRSLLASADLVVGNCESPVVETVRAPLGTTLGVRHAMGERFLANALEAAGIAHEKLVLSVANNHALDQGVVGFDETLAAFRRLGIRAAGLASQPVAKIAVYKTNSKDSSGRPTPTPSLQGGGGQSRRRFSQSSTSLGPDGSTRESPSPLWGGVRGGGELTVGFSAFTQWRNAGRKVFVGRVSTAADPNAWTAGSDEGCDLLCALPHWDWEFRHFPRPETRALAGKLAESGARLVVGGHAHVVQPVERLGGTLVAYSLGDFLGTALACTPWPLRIGALLVVDVSIDPATRGAIVGYRTHFFLRERDGDRERLVPVTALEGPMRRTVFERLRAVYGAYAVEPAG